MFCSAWSSSSAMMASSAACRSRRRVDDAGESRDEVRRFHGAAGVGGRLCVRRRQQRRLPRVASAAIDHRTVGAQLRPRSHATRAEPDDALIGGAERVRDEFRAEATPVGRIVGRREREHRVVVDDRLRSAGLRAGERRTALSPQRLDLQHPAAEQRVELRLHVASHAGLVGSARASRQREGDCEQAQAAPQRPHGQNPRPGSAKYACSTSALAMSAKNAPTIGISRNARGAGPCRCVRVCITDIATAVVARPAAT